MMNVSQMKKSTHPFVQLLVLVMFSLLMLLFTAVLMSVLALAGVDVMSTGNMLWLQGVTQVLTFVVPVLAMTKLYYRGGEKAYYRLDFGGRKWLLALAGVAVWLLLVPLVDWLTVWNDSWHWGGVWARLEEALRSMGEQSEVLIERFLHRDSVGALAVNLLVIALVPAVSEELFFRAGIQNLLQRWFGNAHCAIWVAAAIFSLGHGEVFAFLPRFLLGAMLGYLYVYSGSLIVNMVVHFVNNAVLVVAYWLYYRGALGVAPDDPMAMPWLLTTCCALAAAGIFYATFALSRKGE